MIKVQKTVSTTLFSWLLLLASSCLASTSIGVDSVQGNKLNSSSSHRQKDPKGIATFKTELSRSPAGLLYDVPWLLYQTDGQDFLVVELGALIHDDNEEAAHYREYADWDDGLLVSNFSFATTYGSGVYLSGAGGSVARDDQFYSIMASRVGAYKVQAFYQKTPHVFVNDATFLYQGAGSDNLTLPDALVPGNNSTSEISQALVGASKASVKLTREKTGIKIQYYPSANLELFANYAIESREGSRPFGGSFAPPFYSNGIFGGVVETVEPVDYLTHDTNLGVIFTGARSMVNLAYTGSFFRNGNTSLTWENPFTNGGPSSFVVERGRFALYPDNDYHQLQLDLSRILHNRTQLTGSITWSTMRQDESLLPPTINQGFSDDGIDLDLWNTTAALSRSNSDAKIDSLSVNVSLYLPINSRLNLTFRTRIYDEDNDTEYTAFNPLTGQFGYITEDGARTGNVFTPGTANLPVHYRSIPLEKSEQLFEVEARLRAWRTTNLSLTAHQKKNDYRGREIDGSDETGAKLKVTIRALSIINIRLSYAINERHIDDYDPFPYDEYYTTSRSGYASFLPDGSPAHTLAQMRKFDLAARREQVFNGRVNILVSSSMDLAISVIRRSNDYDSDYGLRERNTTTLNVDWSFQPSPKLNAFLYYSRQLDDNEMRNIQDTGFAVDANAGGAVYAIAGTWQESSDETSDQFGSGISYTGSKFSIDVNYSDIRSNTKTDYVAASNLAAGSAAIDPFATPAFPELRYKQRVFDASIRWHTSEKWHFRGYYRHESNDIRDWHLAGLTPLQGKHLFISHEPVDYSVNTIGLYCQYQF